jgi:Camelysin metallo-endopeptidase
MQDMSTNKRSQSPTARKVVGSLAVIGTAAAVAGLGTYGNFTDSTTPINTTVATGTLSIDLTQPAGAVAVPLNVSGMVPGDSITRAVNLVNDGDVPLSSVSMVATAPAPSILTTDQTNGLQLSVKKCSVDWTQGGTAQAPTYACSGTQTTMLTAPVVTTTGLANPASLTPGGVDRLIFTVSLPGTAGNEFQGKSAGISLSFTGVQRAGAAL